ncbi:MAG: hypothetical protein V4612_06985 [Pseudomonadota bacterium]
MKITFSANKNKYGNVLYHAKKGNFEMVKNLLEEIGSQANFSGEQWDEIIRNAGNQGIEMLKLAINAMKKQVPAINIHRIIWQNIVNDAAKNGVENLEFMLQEISKHQPPTIILNADRWHLIARNAAENGIDALRFVLDKASTQTPAIVFDAEQSFWIIAHAAKNGVATLKFALTTMTTYPTFNTEKWYWIARNAAEGGVNTLQFVLDRSQQAFESSDWRHIAVSAAANGVEVLEFVLRKITEQVPAIDFYKKHWLDIAASAAGQGADTLKFVLDKIETQRPSIIFNSTDWSIIASEATKSGIETLRVLGEIPRGEIHECNENNGWVTNIFTNFIDSLPAKNLDYLEIAFQLTELRGLVEGAPTAKQSDIIIEIPEDIYATTRNLSSVAKVNKDLNQAAKEFSKKIPSPSAILRIPEAGKGDIVVPADVVQKIIGHVVEHQK